MPCTGTGSNISSVANFNGGACFQGHGTASAWSASESERRGIQKQTCTLTLQEKGPSEVALLFSSTITNALSL